MASGLAGRAIRQEHFTLPRRHWRRVKAALAVIAIGVPAAGCHARTEIAFPPTPIEGAAPERLKTLYSGCVLAVVALAQHQRDDTAKNLPLVIFTCEQIHERLVALEE